MKRILTLVSVQTTVLKDIKQAVVHKCPHQLLFLALWCPGDSCKSAIYVVLCSSASKLWQIKVFGQGCQLKRSKISQRSPVICWTKSNMDITSVKAECAASSHGMGKVTGNDLYHENEPLTFPLPYAHHPPGVFMPNRRRAL